MGRMRWQPLSIVFACGALACGRSARTDASAGTTSGTPSASVSVSATNAAPPSASTAAAPPAPPRPPAPPFVAERAAQIVPAASPGCVLETAGKLPVDGGMPLRVDPASAPFVRVTEGGGQLTWPVGRGAPVATITRGAFTLQGFAPEDVKVRAARAVLLAGVFRPTASTTFTLVGSAKGLVVPTIATPLFLPKKPLEPRPCKDFGLDAPTIDPKAGLPVAKTVKKLYLRANPGPLPVSATATSEPVLDLAPALAGAPVTALEESGDRTRFVLEHDHGTVVGWAATRDFTPDPPPQADPSGLGGLGLIGHGAGSGHGSVSLGEYECDQDLGLYADMTIGSVDDQARRPYTRIGTVRKNQVLKVYAGHKGLDRVAGQRLDGVVFTGQGALAVATDEVRKCRRLKGGRK